MEINAFEVNKSLIPEGKKIDDLSKEQILEIIGMDITVLVKSAKSLVDEKPEHSFKHYFKEEYAKTHNLENITLDYILQEKDLVVALRNINQLELHDEINNNNPNIEKQKQLSKWIIELSAVSKALTELSRDKREQLLQALSDTSSD